ncbi:MAG: GntR family transcriptional regulator [Reichenbachiella sp.]|uniref:GntR family transcriptional regulator n=1 Tax=Reichenbachiella sp. TaxID=2184521 RepID=UPI003265C161
MKLVIDHSSSIPLYAQVEALLREMIAMTEYQEGKLLPNEVDMSKELGISRNTLRQATNKLVYEGMLFRKKGVGTMVARPVDSKANNWSSFSQEMKSKGIEVVNFDINFSWVTPEDQVLNFFALDPGTKVLKMERLRGKDTGPFVFFISYFHPRTGLTGKEDFNRPLYEILKNDYSIVAKLSQEEITAEAASKMLAEKLDLAKGDPILKRKRFVFDPGRRPIEFNVGYYRADSIVYTVESEN